MAGDLEREGEKRIINSSFNIKSDILKISHHGSDNGTCEEFLTKVSPEIAIISVGRKNNYGHPSPYVIQRLKKSFVSINLSPGNLDMANQHTISPKFMFIFKTIWLAYDCCNNIGADNTNPRYRHQIPNRTILFSIPFEHFFILILF